MYIYIYIYCVCIQIQLSGCEISINCWPDKHYGAFINLQRLCIKCALCAWTRREQTKDKFPKGGSLYKMH